MIVEELRFPQDPKAQARGYAQQPRRGLKIKKEIFVFRKGSSWRMPS
jgi:hypothetical protein